MDRHCARPGCGHPATAFLTYDYQARTAWLDDAPDASLPSGWELCGPHADRLTVPIGWTRDDRRSAARAALLRPPLAS